MLPAETFDDKWNPILLSVNLQEALFPELPTDAEYEGEILKVNLGSVT